MRTLLLILVMLLVAVAAGLSFVLQAAAQEEGSAELEFGCGPGPVLASGEPTLINCTAVARNTGTVPLVGPQLEFVPSSALQPPDFYLFWSEMHDGAPEPAGDVQLSYDFGDIAPGGFSVIVLEIIVRSTHDFAADAVLVAQPDQREYSRTTIRGTVTPEGGAVVPVKLTRDFEPSPPASWATYHLAILNPGTTPYDSVTAELSPGSGVIVKSDEWRLTSSPGHLAADFGSLAANGELDRELTIIPATRYCTTVRPVLVVTVLQDGVTRRQPVVDDGVLLGPCGGGEPGPGIALPNGGSGPTPVRHDARPLALALLLGGVLLLSLGFSLRTARLP